MNSNTIQVAPDIWTWDWWVQLGLPLVVGAGSLAVGAAALFVALAANRQAAASLALSREVDRREARMPRERVVHEAILTLNEALNRRWEPGDDFFMHVAPAMSTLMMAGGREGIDPAMTRRLVVWLRREAAAIAGVITSDPAEFFDRVPVSMGILALRMSFGNRASEWADAGDVNDEMTVAIDVPDILRPLDRPTAI